MAILRLHRTCIKWRRLHTQKEKYKILFFGTDDFSLHTLKALHQDFLAGQSISQLETCCQSFQKLVPPVKKFSDASSLKVHAWPPEVEVCKQFDLAVVSSFGQLIPSRIINSFPLGMLNVHGSLLPKYRGAAPIPHAILNGDTKTGITIMEIKPHHFDIGHVLAMKECSIEPDETRSGLSAKMAQIGADLMLKVIQDLPHYLSHKVPQTNDSSEISYAPKISKDMFEIGWTQKNAVQIHNQFRALGDISKLYSFWKPSQVKVRFDQAISPDQLLQEGFSLDQKYPESKPGQVVLEIARSFANSSKKRRFLCIKCAQGWIAFDQINYGAKKMTGSDFYSGYIANDKSRHLEHVFTSLK